MNKLDTVKWSKERFDEIVSKLKQFLKQVGFKESDVRYVPCSGKIYSLVYTNSVIGRGDLYSFSYGVFEREIPTARQRKLFTENIAGKCLSFLLVFVLRTRHLIFHLTFKNCKNYLTTDTNL